MKWTKQLHNCVSDELRFLGYVDLLRLEKRHPAPDHFYHQHGTPESDRCHAMRKHCKQRRSLVCIIYPTSTGGPPQLKEVAEPAACDKGEKGKAVICRCNDEQNAYYRRQPCIRFIECWIIKDQHQG